MFRRTALTLAGAALAVPAFAQELPAVRAAGIADDDATAILYGIRAGIFRKFGLNVTYQVLASGAATAAGVVGGSLEIGKSGSITLVNAHERGVPITLVAAGGLYDSSNPIQQLVVPADSSAHGAKDLNGGTIGVGSLKGIEQVCISGWVDGHGGDAKTLHWLELPTSAMRPSLETHRIDAAIMTNPSLSETLAAGTVRVLGPASDGIGPHYLTTAWFATLDWARGHAEQLNAFTRGLREAATYVNAHHAETAAMMAEFTGVTAARYAAVPRVTFGTVLNVADLQPVINAAAKYQTIAKGYPASELIFTR